MNQILKKLERFNKYFTYSKFKLIKLFLIFGRNMTCKKYEFN